jgi:hypothetical protein
LIDGSAHDVLDPVGAGDCGGAVVAAVVDHQHLDRVDPGNAFRQVAERRRQRLGLVVAGALDDELHYGFPKPI